MTRGVSLPARKAIKILHAFRLECEKSMLRTASDYRSLRFLSSLVSRAVAALLELFPSDLRITSQRFSHSESQHGMCLFWQLRGIRDLLAAEQMTLQRSW